MTIPVMEQVIETAARRCVLHVTERYTVRAERDYLDGIVALPRPCYISLEDFRDQRRITMTLKTLVIRALLLFVLSANVVSSFASSTQPNVKGTWSGTFISKNTDIAPFTITVVISANSAGHLIGDASLVSACLDSHRLQVTVTGSNIVLAGSDTRGDTVTFRGTIDNTGTLLTVDDYIINGSASARCEIDNGTGTMGKR